MLSFASHQSAELPSVDGEAPRYRVLPEDVVALDYLTGVVATDDSHALVQYRATDRHKASAGTRVRVVDRINGFANKVLSHGVPVEAALCFAEASCKTVMWMRISLE